MSPSLLSFSSHLLPALHNWRFIICRLLCVFSFPASDFFFFCHIFTLFYIFLPLFHSFLSLTIYSQLFVHAVIDKCQMDGQRLKNVKINCGGVQTSIFCSNCMKQFSVECVTCLPLLIIMTLNINYSTKRSSGSHVHHHRCALIAFLRSPVRKAIDEPLFKIKFSSSL